MVQLSFDEPLAHELHTRLESVFGTRVKRLHRVSPMRRALELSAQLVDTDVYWLADGDFEIAPDFDPAAEPPLADGVAMAVYQAMNPICDLVYAYGGLKLIRTQALREIDTSTVDVLAAIGHVEFPQKPAGTTRFNQTPFHTWRAGFREVAMMVRGQRIRPGPRPRTPPYRYLARRQHRPIRPIWR